MKLLCSTSVSNRSVPMRVVKKAIKSTVALCRHPTGDKYYIILFTTQDKNGTRYDLRQNVIKVLTKFINEGKTTIQFKNPPHDLFIQSDIIPLKSFLHLLHRILEGTISPKELSCSSLNVTPVAPKDIPATKLVIQRRSEYPAKGLPRTLENLTITKINRCSLDLGILRLPRLKVLNLSENCITTLPKEFSLMSSLQVLDLSSNEFHKSTTKDWCWLSGNLLKTLESINFENNQLMFIPTQIIKIQNLRYLNLSRNNLHNLPNGIGKLFKLKELKLSHNFLKELPGSVLKLKLDLIDISHNAFHDGSLNSSNSLSNTVLPICSLKEYSAQRVLDLKIYYNAAVIPATLVAFLDHEAKYCVCGKACFTSHFHKNIISKVSSIAHTVFTASDNMYGPHIPLNCYFCSMACMKIYQKSRVRLVR